MVNAWQRTSSSSLQYSNKYDTVVSILAITEAPGKLKPIGGILCFQSCR